MKVHQLQLASLLNLVLVASAFVTPRPPSPQLTSAANPTSTSLAATWKKVFVAGGSRGVGRCVIDKLLEHGSEVVPTLRTSRMQSVRCFQRFPINNTMIILSVGRN